jgi:hypothetical protein
MRIAGGIRAFVSGPVWAVGGAVSVLSTVIAVVQALGDGSPWMWLFFAALALVIAAFYTFFRGYAEAEENKESLASDLERLLQKGMDQVDAMVAAQKANPGRLGPWNDQEEEAWEFFYEARQLLIDHDRRSLLDDLGERTNEARRREREKQKRPFEKLREREEAGENVTNAEKMNVWGEDLRRSSIGEMEAMLSGVGKVAKHVHGH